jgi:hypothetical protein
MSLETKKDVAIVQIITFGSKELVVNYGGRRRQTLGEYLMR